MSKKVSNTLYGNKQLFVEGVLKNVDNMGIDELVSSFKSLYVICFSDEFFDSPNFDNLSIFESVLSESKLQDYYKNVCLIKAPFKILNNDIMKNSISIISNDIISLLEHKPTNEYLEHTLVVPVMTIAKSDIKLYLSQFKNELLDDYCKIKFMNYFFGNVKKIKDTSYMIENADETNYWTNINNCKLNISLQFMNRNFNFFDINDLVDKKLAGVIENIKNQPEDGGDYLSYMFKKNNFVDASNAIKKDGYLIYKISDKKELSNFEEIIQKLNQEESYEELSILLINVIISKDYCHMILNNPKVLEVFIKLIRPNVNDSVFRQMISYGWLSLYLEETIKRSFTDTDCRFVFNTKSAASLPVFNFNIMKLKENPYFPFFVNDSVFIENNVYGVDNYIINNYDTIDIIDKDVIKNTYGVANLETFKKRMNIFISGNKKNDIFKYVNFDNIAISGSVIAACLPNYNPLILNVGCNFDAFVDEYYGGADVDIMCNIKDTFEYIDKCYELNEAFEKATKELSVENISIMDADKKGNIFINLKRIDEIISELKLTCTRETFKEKIFENKEKLYKIYLNHKIEEHKKYFEEDEEKFKNPKYTDFFRILPMDEIKIHIRDFYELDDELEPAKYMVSDNLKYKFKVSGLKRSFEVFQIKYPNFFSTVHKFHLPCVRAYYDGNDVQILPSCITSCMLLTNIDYKYFAGSKDPIEVINKYRHRGFTTILNDKERIKLVKYSFDVEKWKELYELKSLGKKETDKIFKPLSLDCRFFRPSKVYDRPNILFNKNIYNGYHTQIINNVGYVIPLNKKSLYINWKNNNQPNGIEWGGGL